MGKEAEMKVQLSLASKESNEEPRKITFRRQTPIVQSSYLQSTKIDKSLHECIRKVDSNNAYAINARSMPSLLEDSKRSTLTPSLLDLDRTNFNTSGTFTLKMMRVLTC